MNRMFTLTLSAAVLTCGAGIAGAQSLSTPHSHSGVAVKMTTLGVALEGAVPVHEKLNVRAGFNTFTLNHDFDDDGITLAAQLKLQSFSTYLDYFPFGGGFHVSPGLMIYNGNQVSAIASVPGGHEFDLGDENLISNPANPVTGSAKIGFKRIAPSILMGWGNIIPRSERRWSIPFEIGLVYTRSPIATLALTGGACRQNGTNCRSISSDAGLQSDLAEQTRNLNTDLEVLKMLPVISLGFSYKF
jgi:hypothetical protein